MRQGRGKYTRAGRWVLILASGMLCVCLLLINALDCFPNGTGLSLLHVARFGFAALTALSYLSIGSLVWLFARQRLVAWLVWLFSLAMVVAFANEMVSVHGTHAALLITVTGISVVVALATFAILLVIFPYNYLAALRVRSRLRALVGRILLSLYVGGHLLCAALTAACAVLKQMPGMTLPAWANTLVNLYYVGALLGILCTIVGAYARSRDLRVRQQLWLFVGGVILGVAPVLFLTVIPQAINIPPQYIVNGQLSSLMLLLLPLALGYSILRYQILVVDRYIQRAVAWLVGLVSLSMLCYLALVLSEVVVTGRRAGLVAHLVVLAAVIVLSPLVWWLARVVTEQLFFPEIRYYRQHMQRPEALSHKTFDLHKAAELFLLAATQTFETQEVCLYVLDERSGYYHLTPSLEAYQESRRGLLLRQLAEVPNLFPGGSVEAMDMQHPLIQLLGEAPRPLFLRETLATLKGPAGLARYLMTGKTEPVNPLLVPVRAQGRMIGLLYLGERGNGKTYGGPDFEVIHLLLSHFSSILETARLYVQASRHMAVLNTLYSAGARLERSYLSIEEVAVAYATVVAEAMQGTAEIWLYVPARVVLHKAVHIGQGPSLLQDEWISQLQEQDWSAWFQEGTALASTSLRRGHAPACLAHCTQAPFAWLPLCKGQRRMGVLLLSFPHPHVFAVEEKRLLSMFARQCAAAMENAQITIALRAAYERQKELDELKDQFIMTASHELRTPLTAVQGYIELLNQYHAELSTETRAEFIQKAHRGCDELTLLVGNIMDASRLQIEAERISLGPVDLLSAVQHVMEIMEAVTLHEQRPVELTIAPGLLIQADEVRLRQILLNLISNALKYSPAGTPLRLQAEQQQEMVTISVRDYGAGIPLAEQGRLFERFTRLERDMNSPVRGAGLGLYISKRLVEAMGGRLWVESSGIAGEGSTFAFTLQAASIFQDLNHETTPLLAQPGV